MTNQRKVPVFGNSLLVSAKDLPKPEFVMTKLSDTFTEDEQKQAKEYEKKQAMLLEEREKHRLVCLFYCISSCFGVDIHMVQRL